MENNVKTIVVDNFRGSMTAYQYGDINSGFSYVVTTYGNNPFARPGSLTWSNASERIDSNGDIITDLVMAMKERVEGGILYVYAIGHTGRLYKIQVNDPTTFNPDYDEPSLIATLSAESPTFTRGGFIDFYGTTEQIWIGHDKGVTRINFDGTGETFVGSTSSWTQNVPRPLQQFVGKLYAGNGSNLAEIDTTNLVVSYTRFSPGFPSGSQTRDIDVSPDGTYLHAVVTTLSLSDQTSSSQDTNDTANAESYVFKWNGTDTGYTSFDTFPSFSLTANTMFQQYQYTFGTDQYGAAVFNPTEKLFSLQEVVPPTPNSISSTGNIVCWMSPLSFDGIMEADFLVYGSLDFEIGPGYWDLFGQFASGSMTDIIRVPCQIPVSNFGVGPASNGYTNGVYGTSKIYFSTLETSDTPATEYRFYKWYPTANISIQENRPAMEGALYQTQTQMFSQKITVKGIRIYSEPWVANNSFLFELIGSSGEAITNGSKTFTSGTDMQIGADYIWWNPQIAPTYALGLRVTNLGTANFVITKMEIDYAIGGK